MCEVAFPVRRARRCSGAGGRRGPGPAGRAYPHGDTSEPLNCTLCHTQEGWSPAKQPIEFDHDAETGFPRTGRHAELTCTNCHLGLKFAEPKISAAGCSDCHVDVHLGNLSAECTACHNTTSFNDVPGRRAARPHFAAADRHRTCRSRARPATPTTRAAPTRRSTRTATPVTPWTTRPPLWTTS